MTRNNGIYTYSKNSRLWTFQKKNTQIYIFYNFVKSFVRGQYPYSWGPHNLNSWFSNKIINSSNKRSVRGPGGDVIRGLDLQDTGPKSLRGHWPLWSPVVSPVVSRLVNTKFKIKMTPSVWPETMENINIPKIQHYKNFENAPKYIFIVS